MTMTEMGRMGTRAIVLSVAMSAMAFWPVGGQEPDVEDLDLPRSVADAVVEFFNDSATIRFHGRSGIPGGGEITGDVGVLGGPFTVGGRITGDLMVVNGDLRMAEGGMIDGDVTVIGGSLLDRETGDIRGAVAVYDEPLRYRERRGRISVRDDDRGEAGLRWGRARLTVRSAGSYNRVEGLPVLLGPSFRTAEPNPLRFEAFALWRTESGLTLDNDELGYVVRVEQRLGHDPRLSFGAGAHSQISPIAEWGLRSLESSLATFLSHQDYRDHYEREGWSVWVGADLPDAPVTLRLELRDEKHRFAPVSSPWTLRRNDAPWRPQPLVAEGDLRTLTGEAVWDDRNDPERPSHGWYGRLHVVRGLDGDLRTPETLLPSSLDLVPAAPVPTDFTAGFLDLRRYTRVTPESYLSFRLVYGGSIDGSTVPSQFQQALGGEGSLPGYRLFAGDCGARATTRRIERPPFDDDDEGTQTVFPHYGCDRAVLFQLEYRSDLDLSFDIGPDHEEDWDEDWDWYPVIDFSPTWSFFLNTGRGWSGTDEALDTGTMADVGLGLLLGDLGLYWAYPLDGGDRGLNFFVRLQYRF